MKHLFKQTFFLRPRPAILIFLILAALMLASALIELNRSKKELLELMENQSHTLLETMLRASRNSLLSTEMAERFWREHFFNNARYIRTLYESGQVNSPLLNQIAEQDHISRVDIFSRTGKRLFSASDNLPPDPAEESALRDSLKAIFDGTSDSLLIDIQQAADLESSRITIAVAATDRSAIVLNLNAAALHKFNRQISFGILLRDVTQHPGIIYAALQDSSEILAASGNVQSLDKISESAFLYKSLHNSTFETRLTTFATLKVFEAVHPFYYKDKVVGLFRLGLSIKPLEAINSRIYRRILIISGVLIAIGSFLIGLILMRQNMDVLQKEYREIETYSGGIIQSVSDAILMADGQSQIRLFNKAAEELFHCKEADVLNRSLTSLLEQYQCEKVLQSGEKLQQIECTIKEKKHFLLISRTLFSDKEGNDNIILVIRDLTDQKILEGQIQRKYRLSAMGELASGVAHEIRNPLNTIGTIVQQLDKDFEPVKDGEEYHQLAGLVYNEVRRINKTVQEFLRFARPEPIHPQPFVLSGLMQQLQQQYHPFLGSHNITCSQELNWDGEVEWDRQQIQQTLMNLIQNAVDVLPEKGHIAIKVNKVNASGIEIQVSDNGPGIPADIRHKIFNLYFTTRAQGTGIGLSLVQRVIDEHGGTIAVHTEEHRGTTFIIRMPIQSQK